MMKSFIKILIYTCSIISTIKANDDPNKKKKILSFGGNGMIGSNTLETLIATNKYDITLVSRGSWPFDTSTSIKPYVNHVFCDRDIGLENCGTLVEDISNTTEYYAVLDFSGFLPSWIEDAVKVLKGKVRVYVYVSSDSVYEVCEDGEPLGKYGKLVETDAVRPFDDNIMRKLNAEDEYGDEKLGGEEVLVNQAVMDEDGDGDSFPYVILRYADVIGRRDATDRFATYVMWAMLQQMPPADPDDIPNPAPVPDFHVPNNILERSSITYVSDATQSILSSIYMPDSWNEAYNIASAQIFNVTNAIEMIATSVYTSQYQNKINYKPKVIKVDADDGIAMYPSVTRGPVNIEKAITKLKFRPTPMNQIISNTVDWYLEIFESDLNYRDVVIEEWEDNLFQDSNLFSNRVHDKVMQHVWSKISYNSAGDYYDGDGNPTFYDDDDDEEDEDEDEDEL